MKPTTTGPLEWREEILQEVFRHTLIGVVVTDLHGTILEINAALCTMLGYPREQLIGRSAMQFLHPDEKSETSDFLGRVRDAEAGSLKATRRLTSRSGNTIWASVTLSVVRSADDEPIFGMALVEDIGERLEMEEALRRSAALYRQVVQDQTELIVRWKADGTRTFVNEAYAKYFGLSESELIGTSFFPLIVREDLAMIEKKIAGLTPDTPMLTDVHRVILADGSVRWNEWTDRATFDDSGQIVIIQSIGRDVTERVEANDALRTSEARHRRLFEDLPIAAWEVDWSAMVAYCRELGLRSADDLSHLAAADRAKVVAIGHRLRVVAVNAAAMEMAGVSDKAAFDEWLPTSYEATAQFIAGVAPLLFGDRDSHESETVIHTARGERRTVLIRRNRIRQSETGWTLLNTCIDLTERQRIESELAQQREQLEQAEALAHIGYWEFDLATNTAVGSREQWRIYDGVDGGPLTRTIDEALTNLHPEDRITVENTLRRLRESAPGSAPDLPTEWDLRFVRPDGSLRWTRSTCIVESQPDALPRIFGILQDVTERELAEDAVRRSEQMYRDLFHNLPVAAWESDYTDVIERLRSHGISTSAQLLETLSREPTRIMSMMLGRRIVEANQNALELFAVSDIAALGRVPWQLHEDPAHRLSYIKTMAQVILGEVPKAMIELQLSRSDGSPIEVDALISSSALAPGRIIMNAIDITERKKIERELLHSQLLLEEAQTIAQLGSWEISLERDEIFGSRQYWKTMDVHDYGPRTRKLSETLLGVHPEDRERVYATIVNAHAAFVSGTAEGESVVEYRVVSADGSVRICRGQGLFTRTANGEIRGYGIQQDITEIKRVEEEVRRQREELTRADRMISLGILVSGVAHEINNPNQFIMLNAPFLRNAWKELEPVIDQYAEETPGFRVSGIPWEEMRREIPEILAEIDRGAERIRSIVSELRNFGRDHDRTELRPASVNEIIEGSLRLLSNHIKRATSKFRTQLASGLPLILANPQRLEQVIVNLVMNSCQALTRGDAAITVMTAYDAAKGAVVVSVVDEGGGISAEDLKKVRDPFFTTKRAEGGMGLGLAVSDRIVEEHNGLLTFNSELGRGTTATVSLPALHDREH